MENVRLDFRLIISEVHSCGYGAKERANIKINTTPCFLSFKIENILTKIADSGNEELITE